MSRRGDKVIYLLGDSNIQKIATINANTHGPSTAVSLPISTHIAVIPRATCDLSHQKTLGLGALQGSV